jgi:anti-sigma factor RsiW
MPQPAVCPDLTEYKRLAAGELADADEEALLAHLEDCDPCAQKLNTLAERDTLVALLRRNERRSGQPRGRALAPGRDRALS